MSCCKGLKVATPPPAITCQYIAAVCIVSDLLIMQDLPLEIIILRIKVSLLGSMY